MKTPVCSVAAFTFGELVNPVAMPLLKINEFVIHLINCFANCKFALFDDGIANAAEQRLDPKELVDCSI